MRLVELITWCMIKSYQIDSNRLQPRQLITLVQIRASSMRRTTSPYLQVLIIVLIRISGTKYAESRSLLENIPCNHDEVAERNPYVVKLTNQEESIRKRALNYANIRIHPVLTSRANEFIQGNNSALSKAIRTLQSLLLIRPVQGNLTIPPKCKEYTSGLNEGKCVSPLPPQSDYKCGRYGVIPLAYIGTREVCNSSNSSCTMEGPNGPGLPNADYLLFVSVASTSSCFLGTLAYASHCMLDVSDNNRPLVGYITICLSALESLRRQPDVIYGLFMHEIIHALGFSSSLFDKYVDANGNAYNAAEKITGPYGDTHIFTGPKTLQFARQYYACDDIEGVYLENEGGSGTASSHWEKRTLNHELMSGYISYDYDVLSEFTLVLLEDSGWYKANYTALHNLKQNPLQWGKGLGCAFLNERCTNHSVFPYLCDTRDTQLICTYDHLTKGTCSTGWTGFDGCPVAVAAKSGHYCRNDVTIYPQPFHYAESYGDSSICIDGIRSLSCSTLRMSHCMRQETYAINGSHRYALHFEDEKYECQDGHALTTNHYFVPLCPPNEEIVSRSPLVRNGTSSLSPSTVAITDLDALENNIHSRKSIVAFGELNAFHNVNIKFYVNSKESDGTGFICLLSGCTRCTTPILVDNNTSILSTNRLYTVARGTFAASAVFVDSLTQSSDYTLVLMFAVQATHSFVCYAAAVDFIGGYLQALHSNDDFYIRVVALASNTEIRIAVNQDAYINESYYVFHREEIVYTLGIGETVVVSSKYDLTGTRVTANNIVSFYSGHYCAPGRTTNCSILNEQLPPYNSWGNTFVLHTNINGLRGNMFKIIASDVGAYVFMNCTTDGTNYKANKFNLGFRQHTVLSVTHDYCTVKSDKSILIIQFRDSSPPLMDTFMTIIPALVHYEDNYVFNTYKGFDNYIVITVKDLNVTTNSIMLDDSPITVKWQAMELDEDAYHFVTLKLTPGRHKISFLENSTTFGVMIYGSNENDTFALPVGMRMKLDKNFTSTAPSSVNNLLLTVISNVINVTWSPPSIANGEILQYIVQRITSGGTTYHYVSGNQKHLELPYFYGALVFVAAVNQYGQSSFEVAKSSAPCRPSPCINGKCFVWFYRQYCDCPGSSRGQYCESTQKLYPFGLAYNDTLLPTSDDGHSSLIHLSEDFVFYNKKSRIVYVNNNGIVSFDKPFASSSVKSLPLSGSDKIIAPYWADVDTRGTGKVYYRQATDPSLLARASSEIQKAFSLSRNFTIMNLFIVTWDAVGFYPTRADKRNTFQCILASSQYESFVIFLYADIQWAGSTRGAALAGINAGDGHNHVTIFGSRTSSIHNIQRMSNVGIPGVWIFKIGEDCRPSIYTCISEFYPFGLAHGDTTLSQSRFSDGSSSRINLTKDFYFYEDAVKVVYVNDNGIISLNSYYNYAIPRSLPLRETKQIIAPYWADVDTRGTGKIFYRQSTDPVLLARASKDIQRALSLTQIEIKHLLIATWEAVGYYNHHTDKVNTFQCILATSKVESFVIFLYADLQWTTGDSSFGSRGLGGLSKALAGYNAGDRINHYTLPGSRTPGIVDIVKTSNVGVPGTWIFKVGEDCARRVVKDVVFVIDTSSSIGYSKFQLVRELTEDIATRLKMNSPETLFGLITFDDYARFQFDISNYTDLSTLLPAINSALQYNSGYGTNTASALNLLLSGGVEGGFLQLRDNTSNVAIVITDGYSSSYSSLYSVANSLHAANIFDVYAVGIGNNSLKELQLVASDSSFVFSINSLTSVTAQQLVDDVMEQSCSIHKPRIFLRPNYLQQGTIGEPHDLVCLIALSSTAQSSSIDLTWNFTGNDDRVTVIPTTITTDDSIGIIYTTVIQFDYLMEEDEEYFKCTLRFDGDSTHSIFNLKIIYPIVAVEVTAAVDPTIYQPLVLQCTATIVRGITSTVDIIWTTGNTQVRRVNNVTASSNINSSSIYNDSFIIPSLKISDARNVYQCQVLINSVLPTATTADFIISIPGRKCLDTSIQDVVFVIDVSNNIGSSHFQLIRECTANITAELLRDSPRSSVGVILFDSNAHIQFSLQTYTSLSSLLSAINSLPYSGGSSTDTDEALTLLLSSAKNGVLGLRSDSSKVAIVITSGQSNHQYLTSAAAALHASNIFDVVAIGFDEADLTELQEIASSPEFVFFANSFDGNHLKQLQRKILLQLCNYSFLNVSLQPSGYDQNTVGQRQDVICKISVSTNVDHSAIELAWLNKDDIITDDHRVTIDASSDHDNAIIIQFDPLTEEDEGEYTCYAMINGSFLFQSISLQNFTIPIPLVQITIFDDETLGLTNLVIGDPLTLDCTVTAVRGISSSVDIIWTTGGRVVRRVDNITADIENDSVIYTDSFEISSLSAIDNGREYQCTVVINASPPVYSSDRITLILNTPACFNTTYCEGDSFSDNALSFSQCCFQLSGASFASSGRCLVCPKDETCQPNTATCVTEFYFFGLPENDTVLSNSSVDDTSGSITLSEAFNFYGQIITDIYVGDNGIIGLNSPYNMWTPESIPFSVTRFIAPYWADVDLTGTGQIYYRQTKDPVLLARATDQIQRAFPLPYPSSYYLTATNLFIVTWDAVGYYFQQTDKTNTFQCVLVATITDSFVIFLYADGRIQWTTGGSSGGTDGIGGTEALAGINAGDGVNSVTIPGSLTPGIINITQTSNVGIPGVWIFKVGEGYRCSGNSLKDVVFVIDTTFSIGSTRFQLIRKFTANITAELIRNSPRSSVGVILFDRIAHIQFNLQAYSNSSALLSAINNLPYSGRPNTDTAEALTLLLSTAQNGALGLRSDSSKVVIFITDGRSDDKSETFAAADALHASNIFNIITVGISGADMTELQRIASSRELVFFTHYFNSIGLQELKDKILSRLCIDQTIPDVLLPPTRSTVGQRQDVICSISVPPDVDPDTIELGWLNEDDIITDDSRVTIVRSSNGSSNLSASVITAIIQFDPLFEDDVGNYSCYSIASKSIKYTSTELQNFTIPSPLVQISLHDNKILGNESVGDLIIGDPLTLDCTVTAVRGISSLVDIIWTTGSRVVRRVDNITADIESDSAIYTDSFEISSLSAIDNGTEYQCRVVINARQPVYNSIKVTLIFTADVDECALDIDDCDQLCVNDLGSYHCECYTGYFIEISSCVDINECAGDHGCSHLCNNTDGSFHCYCNPGYMLHSNGTTCIDINECLVDNGGCEFSCTNLEGINNTTGLGYQCGCDNGYQLASNNHDCEDIPNCAINDHNCSQICVELEGSFSCSCYPGYELQEDRATCLDINECIEGLDRCDHNCTNTAGSYFCTCKDGYELGSDNYACTDIDECARGTDGCHHICNNTVGGYFCSCNPGYASTSDHKYCTAMCPAGCFNDGNCSSPGICTCPSGWTGSDCRQDVDECALDIDDCDQLCVNDLGSYHCECYTGYFIEISSCVDINECAGDHGCHHLCNNTDGSFHCYCNPGYMLHSNGTTCTDINECLVDNGGCEFSCTNLEGINNTTGLGYQCGCDNGYQLAPNNHDCNDILNCLINDHNCSQVCVELEGLFGCSCYPGYELQEDRATCEDIDECLKGISGCDHNCTNTDGSYFCTCMDGYELESDNHTCTDINECLDNNVTCSHDCVNTEGSYHCECFTGYILQLNKYDCEDINECVTDNGGCDHICTNIQGSFNCQCNTSYILAADNKTCVPYVTDCDYVLEKQSGYINTSGFPNSPYAPYSNCTWIIDLPAYKRIDLRFKEMAIEDSPNCAKDRVTILNGKDESSLSLGSYCGSKLPTTIQSSTGAVTIKFISDGSVNNRGFSIHYRGFKKRSKGVYKCYLANNKPTVFALPTFPSKYNGPVDCLYYFLSPSRGQRIKITFLYLDILAANCSTDRIEIYNGHSPTSSKIICNGNRIVEFISSNEIVKMKYIGNSVGKYRGFHAVGTFL